MSVVFSARAGDGDARSTRGRLASAVVKYATAVGHVRMVVEACADAAAKMQAIGRERPYVLEAWVFGALLDAPQEIEATDVAFVVDAPAAEVPWGAEPGGLRWFTNFYRIDRYPVRWFARPVDRPVVNHRIRRPVHFWSTDGPHEAALQALAEGRVDDLPRAAELDAEGLDRQLDDEAATVLAALGGVVDAYWQHDWRREQRDGERGPEHELYDLAWGLVDLDRGRRRLRDEPAGVRRLHPDL